MRLHLNTQIIVLVNLGQRKCLVEHRDFLDNILHQITIGVVYGDIRYLANDFQQLRTMLILFYAENGLWEDLAQFGIYILVSCKTLKMRI